MKAAQISRQHLVSQVLLKQFTMAEPDNRGPQVRPVDVRYPERSNKLKSTRACGWVDTFVAYDSPSAEDLWNFVERRAPAAFEAVHTGTPFADPLHVEALRDLIVLHYVRSHRYRDVYTNAFETVRVKARSELVERFPEPLRRVRGGVPQCAAETVPSSPVTGAGVLTRNFRAAVVVPAVGQQAVAGRLSGGGMWEPAISATAPDVSARAGVDP